MNTILQNKMLTLLLTFVLIGIGLGISYNVVGSHINESGMLIESFWMIPMSYLFLLIGFGGALIIAVKKLVSALSA